MKTTNKIKYLIMKIFDFFNGKIRGRRGNMIYYTWNGETHV